MFDMQIKRGFCQSRLRLCCQAACYLALNSGIEWNKLRQL